MNDRRDKPRPKSILTNIYDATHDVLRKYMINSILTNDGKEPQAAPTCLVHGMPMVLVIYDRPGSPPGNGWACRMCAAERTQQIDEQEQQSELVQQTKYPDRLVKTVYVEPDVQSRDVLLDFARYCEDHPQERFWQALRNWAGVNFILTAGPGYLSHDHVEIADHDTFHREGK
jgi:hypothetical protein